MNNPKITLEVIQEQYKKFGILNKEQQNWLIEMLEMMIGVDPQFVPMIVCGIKQSNIASADGNKIQAVSSWRILPSNMPGVNISEILVNIAITIAFRVGISIGKNQDKPKSNIIEPN